MPRENDETMQNAQLVPAEIDPNYVPEALRNSVYYVGNDESVQLEMAVKAEILDLQKDLDPWEAKAAKMFAAGQSIRAIARDLNKRQGIVSEALDKVSVMKLVHHWQHLEVLRDGPNEILRKQMLWRIAVDNERKDPKEATKALAELNKMAAPKHGAVGGNTVNIVISHATLQKGALDE